MNILLVGSGGREHALAWKIAQSPLLTRLAERGLDELGRARRVVLVERGGVGAVILDEVHHGGDALSWGDAKLPPLLAVDQEGGQVRMLRGDAARETASAETLGAEGPQAVADAVLDLWRHPERAAAMGVRGRDLVRERYDWAKGATAFVGELTDVAAERSPRR